ncbi:MAG: hypothetical protein HY508_04885 [Acidobacteria bacterium]|nr:hypothetical protein [Acidobacteriota bacterium]
MKPNFLHPHNLVHMPGPASLTGEVSNVPHGVLHHHFYHSGIVGDFRDYFVYTPPGCGALRKMRYPVLYLLQGYSDNDIWWLVGDANVSLDNLIAHGKGQADDHRDAARQWRAGDRAAHGGLCRGISRREAPPA